MNPSEKFGKRNEFNNKITDLEIVEFPKDQTVSGASGTMDSLGSMCTDYESVAPPGESQVPEGHAGSGLQIPKTGEGR